MTFKIIIPARYASTRLPGKPLQMIAGKPMVQHVYERAIRSQAEQVIVATDDQRIFDAVKKFGGEVCMTKKTHDSGTDRLQEVAVQYQFDEHEIVVNVQGDEPLIPPAVINQVANNLAKNPQASVATLSEPICQLSDLNNPNVVKVIKSLEDIALYFSRAPIPFARNGWLNDAGKITAADDLLPQRHIGIYAYRVNLLHDFIRWPMATLEKIECLEQLRVLANNKNIHIAEAIENVPGGVDTAEDLEKVRQLFQ